MSILSDLIHGKIDEPTAFKEAENWLGQTETSIEKSITSDPVVQAQINTALDAGKQAISIGAQWAGTALSGELGNLAVEASALVSKYAPLLIGEAAGGPLGAAAVTAIQAVGDVGISAIQHAIASALTQTLPKPAA
jgi:hypothetical protein